MQHIASRESLKATNDFLLSTAESLDEEKLTALGLRAGVDLRPAAQRGSAAPDAVRDTRWTPTTRENIAERLLSGKISVEAVCPCSSSPSRQHWSSSRDLQEAMRRVSRTAMFRRAERTGELDEVEDQLFRFSRIVDASPELSVILDDPDRRPDTPGRRWSTGCCPVRHTRWSPNWSTRWPGTPRADRSPTACGNWSTRPPNASRRSSRS